MTARTSLGLPSLGFWTLLFSHGLLLWVIVWGCRKPLLDEAFEVLMRRELVSNAEYSAREVGIMQRTWDRHPGFGRALVGKSAARFIERSESGWISRRKSHLAVRPATTEFVLAARGAAVDFPLTVSIRGHGFSRELKLALDQPAVVRLLPGELSLPTILDIEIAPSRRDRVDEPSWAVRLSGVGADANEAP